MRRRRPTCVSRRSQARCLERVLRETEVAPFFIELDEQLFVLSEETSCAEARARLRYLPLFFETGARTFEREPRLGDHRSHFRRRRADLRACGCVRVWMGRG